MWQRGKAKVGIGAKPTKSREEFNKKDKNGDGKLDAKVSREAWEGQCLVWKVMWEQMMLRVGVC